jgi:hypothetical protein
VRDNPKTFNCKTCGNEYHCNQTGDQTGDQTGEWPKSIGAASYNIITIDRDGYQLESKTCLIPQITQRTNYLFKLHKHYSNSILLIAGGLYDQPNLYLDAMEIIDR